MGYKCVSCEKPMKLMWTDNLGYASELHFSGGSYINFKDGNYVKYSMVICSDCIENKVQKDVIKTK